MEKILNVLDFAKNKKTLFSSVFMLMAMYFTLKGVVISEADLMELFNTVINQSEVIIGACGIIYGGVMKIIRKAKS
jgi:predicted nucleic-acid-binding protein